MDEQEGARMPYRRMLALMRYRGLVGGEAVDTANSQQRQFEEAVGHMLDNQARAVEQFAAQVIAQIPNQAARDFVSTAIGAQFEMQRQTMDLALRQAEDMMSHAWRAYGDVTTMLGRAGLTPGSREPRS